MGFDWILVGILWVLAAVISFVFARWRDPLRKLKDICQGQPIWSILAAAAVMIAEAVWGEYSGRRQLEEACRMLSDFLAARGIKVSPEQLEEIVQRAYETMKELLGEHWGALKLARE